MNIATVKTAVTRVGGRSLLKVRKYSPEILVAAGIAGFVTSVVMASKATLKLESTLQTATERIQDAKVLEQAVEEGERVYTDKQVQREITIAYVHNVLDIIKLYGPSVSLVIASGGSVLAAHGIMRRRNVALVAAYNVLEKSFANYRDRVVEELGIDRERDIRAGVRDQEIEDPETGKKVKVASLAENPSQYARIFEKGSTSAWEPHPHYNMSWILSQQEYFNQMLVARGHVFLNEVYDALGFERTRAGAVVGWVIGDRSSVSDNYIDFNIYDLTNERKRAFINGMEDAIMLDFNVDGVIYDKI